MQTRCAGIWPATPTPFQADGRVDTHAFVAHCEALLRDGAHGLGLLGTTGEANSLSLEERQHLLDEVVRAGIAAGQLLPGTGCCAIADTVALTRHAMGLGCAGILLVPPFFYKPVSEQGLCDYVSQVITGVECDSLAIYLYHIPQFSGVPWPMTVIERLSRDFPEQIAGVKDSSGDRAHLRSLLTRFPSLSIFPGSESLLLEGMRLGAAGCISGSANVNMAAIRRLYDRRKHPDAAALAESVKARREVVETRPLIASVKSLLFQATDNRAWQRVRPPLRSLSTDHADALAKQFLSINMQEANHG